MFKILVSKFSKAEYYYSFFPTVQTRYNELKNNDNNNNFFIQSRFRGRRPRHAFIRRFTLFGGLPSVLKRWWSRSLSGGLRKPLLRDRPYVYNNNKAESFVNANVPAPGQAADGYCVRDDCDFRSRNQSPIVLQASERHVAVRLGGTRFVPSNNGIHSRGTSLWFRDLEISAKSESEVVCAPLNPSLNLLRFCFTRWNYLDVNEKTLVCPAYVHLVLCPTKNKC